MTASPLRSQKIQSALESHNSGLKLLTASENPKDINLISQVENFSSLVARLVTLGRFVILDLGAGLPTYTQRLLSFCNERVVVFEGLPNTIDHTKILIDEIASLNIDRNTIIALLNNRQRSEGQLSANKAQERLEHPIAATITPAPELFLQAMRVHSPAVISQPSNMTSQQFLKIADAIIKTIFEL